MLQEPAIVSVLHGPVEKDMDESLFYVAHGETHPLALEKHSKSFMRAHARTAEFQSNPVLLKLNQQEIASARRRLEQAWGTGIAERVETCRRMIFLINTLGGDVMTSVHLQQFAGIVKRNGGTVTGYVAGHAMSAGAQMFSVMDTRLCLPHTRCMWHVRQALEEHNILTVDELENDVQEIEAFFSANVTSHQEAVRESLRTAFAQRHDPSAELCFTGAQLEAFGVVRTAPDAAALQAAFAEREPDAAAAGGSLGTVVGTFFSLAKAEEAAENKFHARFHIIPRGAKKGAVDVDRSEPLGALRYAILKGFCKRMGIQLP